ncbi:MAG: hypothetical protein ACI8ZB_001064 [Desulforhopalus sp.]|jgi:hypothetical protein
MKTLINLTVALFLLFFVQSQVFASDRGVNGLIIGGGAGALMGQAVGRNVESTIIGATVGGIIGAVIGAESSSRRHDTIIVQKPPRGPHGRYYNHSPRHNAPTIVYSKPQYRGHHFGRDKVVVVKKKHGNYKSPNRGQYNQRNHRPKRFYSNNNRY